jgi:hypothetical protein
MEKFFTVLIECYPTLTIKYFLTLLNRTLSHPASEILLYPPDAKFPPLGEHFFIQPREYAPEHLPFVTR